MTLPGQKRRSPVGLTLKFVNMFCLAFLLSIVTASAQDDSSDSGSGTTLQGGASYNDSSGGGGSGTDYFYSNGGGDSNGGGADTFNSNSDNGGGSDIFNSNPGDEGGGERPEPYPTPPSAVPLRPQCLGESSLGRTCRVRVPRHAWCPDRAQLPEASPPAPKAAGLHLLLYQRD
jgi:hypothetical protein